MKFKVGELVYIKTTYYGDHGLVEATVEKFTEIDKTRSQVPYHSVSYYTLKMKNHYVDGNSYESWVHGDSFLAMEQDGCNCTEDYIVPYGPTAKVLYGRK